MHSKNSRPVDGGTILKSEVLQLAKQRQLRLRAFGENVTYGEHRPFDGDMVAATEALSRLIDDGLVVVYRDEDGVFIGPHNPAMIEAVAGGPHGE